MARRMSSRRLSIRRMLNGVEAMVLKIRLARMVPHIAPSHKLHRALGHASGFCKAELILANIY
jgi:hypothetical protein